MNEHWVRKDEHKVNLTEYYVIYDALMKKFVNQTITNPYRVSYSDKSTNAQLFTKSQVDVKIEELNKNGFKGCLVISAARAAAQEFAESVEEILIKEDKDLNKCQIEQRLQDHHKGFINGWHAAFAYFIQHGTDFLEEVKKELVEKKDLDIFKKEW